MGAQDEVSFGLALVQQMAVDHNLLHERYCHRTILCALSHFGSAARVERHSHHNANFWLEYSSGVQRLGYC